MTLAEKIKQLRKSRNWSQETLAGKINVQRKQIVLYENGDSNPSIETLRNLAIALNVTTDFLLFDTEEQFNEWLGIHDEELFIYFKSIEKMSPEIRKSIKTILKQLILKQQ